MRTSRLRCEKTNPRQLHRVIESYQLHRPGNTSQLSRERAFDDLNDDLHLGRHPTPTCIAEEIALDMAIQDAERLHHDERELIADLEAELPSSRSDYNWNTLQDVLLSGSSVCRVMLQ